MNNTVSNMIQHMFKPSVAATTMPNTLPFITKNLGGVGEEAYIRIVHILQDVTLFEWNPFSHKLVSNLSHISETQGGEWCSLWISLIYFVFEGLTSYMVRYELLLWSYWVICDIVNVDYVFIMFDDSNEFEQTWQTQITINSDVQKPQFHLQPLAWSCESLPSWRRQSYRNSQCLRKSHPP